MIENASVRSFLCSFLAVDTPDPYVVLMVQGAPNCYQRTNSIDNNTDPEWNETFKFYLNPKIPSEIGMYGHLKRVYSLKFWSVYTKINIFFLIE